MIAFEVNDMTCGHCVNTITRAIRAADPAALVRIDLATHRVHILSSTSDSAHLSNAIRAAGYSPMAVAPGGSTNIMEPAPARGGCCCGANTALR
jgi:copper chaperone